MYFIKNLLYYVPGIPTMPFLNSKTWHALPFDFKIVIKTNDNNKKQYIITDDNHMTKDSNLYINPIKYLYKQKIKQK